MDIANPVFKMLATLLQHDGLLSDKISTRYFSSRSTLTLGDKSWVQPERAITAEISGCSLNGIPVSNRHLRPNHNTSFRLTGSDDTGR